MADARKPNPLPRVRRDTTHIAGHKRFAVKFTRLDEDTRNRIGRADDRQRDRPVENNAIVRDGGCQR
jgi:hypothetical protein